MRDERLIELLKSDPDRGMRRLIETYSGLVWAIVRGRLRAPYFGEEDVEECVSDAFTKLWLSRESLDPSKGSVKSWLARSAVNCAVDRLRRAMREGWTVPLDELSEILTDDRDTADRAERLAVIEAVEALGKPDSEIIVRKYYLGQSSREIAERLHMTVSVVDTRTHRAIKRLKRILGEQYDEEI